MQNPMLGALNQSKLAEMMNQIAPIKQAMNMVRSSGNPQMMLQQIMSNNPQYAQVMNIIQQNGGDPQKAFYAMANQLGVDPNDVLNALR